MVEEVKIKYYLEMTTILDDEQDNIMGAECQSTLCNQSNLLDDWVCEQTDKIEVILTQLKRINDLPLDKLDKLCDYLEDIDYHTSGLGNILSMLFGFTNNAFPLTSHLPVVSALETENTSDNNLLPKKWSLLNALWFHMMMITDSESIYYSPRIGRDVWQNESNGDFLT